MLQNHCQSLKHNMTRHKSNVPNFLLSSNKRLKDAQSSKWIFSLFENPNVDCKKTQTKKHKKTQDSQPWTICHYHHATKVTWWIMEISITGLTTKLHHIIYMTSKTTPDWKDTRSWWSLCGDFNLPRTSRLKKQQITQNSLFQHNEIYIDHSKNKKTNKILGSIKSQNIDHWSSKLKTHSQTWLLNTK